MNWVVHALFMLSFVNTCFSSIASFYGESFIFQSVGSVAKNSTVISLQFYTSSSDGILLHATAAGNSQYFQVSILNGQLMVKINLGYGEELLTLSEDKQVNDLLWHRFKVIRSGRNIKLNLNGNKESIAHITAPGSSVTTFNPNFGVFLGGIGGNISTDNSISSKFFRGCLIEAKFNGQDLLSSVEKEDLTRIESNLFSGCPQIFSSSQYEPFTFSSPSSYIALDRWLMFGKGHFECMLKTTKVNGIILYHAGRVSGEFIVLEMVDGVIGASVNKGGGILGLRTTKSINDGLWHSIKFTFDPSYLDIRVDGNRTKAFFEQQSLIFSISPSVGWRGFVTDPSRYLYIGGVPQHFLHSGIIHQGLLSLRIVDGKAVAGGAFPGCVKHIKVNHRRKGFHDFISTYGVSSGCSLKPFTSLSSSGMNYWEASKAISELHASFSQPILTTTHFPEPSTTTQMVTTSLPDFRLPSIAVSTDSLETTEGGSTAFTKQHITWTTSSSGRNLSDNEILIVMRNRLKHGSIVKATSCSDDARVLEEFSIKDVTAKSLLYCHDGSDTLSDYFNFSVVWDLKHLTQQKRNAIIKNSILDDIEYLSTGIVIGQEKDYKFPIVISPVDDPPRLSIPLDYIFRPIRLVPTHFSSKVLNATDSDTSRSSILYSVLGETEKDEFLIENDDYPGRSIVDFSQADLDANKITFTYKSDRDNTRLLLRLFNPPSTDGNPRQENTAVVLRIAPQLLNISASVKELNLLEKSSIIIADTSISVSSNSESGLVDFVVHIVREPSLGVLELKNSNSGWTITNNFTISIVEQGLVRYRNTERTELQPVLDHDDFSFYLSAVGVHSPTYTLPIAIKKVNVLLSLATLILDQGIQEVMFTANHMNITTNDVTLYDERIQIGLKMQPKHAELFYNDRSLIIGSNDTFTYQELKQGRISLRVKTRYAARSFQEMIHFYALVEDLYMSPLRMMNVTYVPDLDRITLLQKVLHVEEGREKTIGARYLKASLPASSVNSRIKKFKYQILQFPEHGVLKKKSISETGRNLNLSKFQSTDVESNVLVYQHDNSETTSDFFTFRVSPVLEGCLPEVVARLSNVSQEANYSIEIMPVNDQRPHRVMKRIFEVQRNGERLITLDDIYYEDLDSDFDDLDLMISKRGLTNGEIFNATSRNHQKISRFTQRQIKNGEVLFQHRGSDNGRLVFWVRDGKHHVPGLITISASEPYLTNANASVVSVVRGKRIVISSDNLAYVTNVKGSAKDIIYTVSEEPVNGVLYISTPTANNSMRRGAVFTQKDINNRALLYEHAGSSTWSDEIFFSVTAASLSAHGRISIKVQLESHSTPPSVQKNHTITVAQGRKVEIRKQNLRIVHPDVRAGDISFVIVKPPRFGELIFHSEVDSQEFNVQQVNGFTQADINQGKVWYAQNDSSQYTDSDFVNGELLDSFVFNVTNGLMNLADQIFFIDIIPWKIPLRVGNFSVQEGSSKAMIRNYLWIEGQHFDNYNIEIRIVASPFHGIFESSQQDNVALKSFSYRLAVEEFIYYDHDDSDYLQDNFSLRALTLDGQRSSDVVVGYISIIPENDEKPEIINNTGLHVWKNSVTMLLPSALAAYDPDTIPELLNFQVLPPRNGFLALVDDPTHPIFNFTQDHINNGKVVFVHTGARDGGFTFQCDDGFEPTKRQIFTITAKPLTITVKQANVIQAFPGAPTVVSSRVLSSATNDLQQTNRTITYTITFSPSFGRLVKKSGLLSQKSRKSVSAFTQQDINHGNLFFVQDVNIEKWTATDSFVVIASSPPAENVSDIKVSINITYDAIQGRSPIQLNSGLSVIEGGKVHVNTSVLDARNLFKKLPFHRDKKHYKLIYSLEKLPSHGNLSVSGKNLTELNSTFSQSTLEENEILYIHDDSDTLKDIMHLRIYLVDTRYKSSTGSYWIVPDTTIRDHFNITIQPLNDNPPVLLTKGKIFHVVDGFEKLVSNKYINSSDLDSGPSEIKYSIIRQPTKGRVAFVHAPAAPIRKFTQADVSLGRVLFIPSQLNLTDNAVAVDFFYFSVTDGIQRPAYNPFQIKIHAVYLRFEPISVNLRQGTFSTTLSAKVLNAATNGNVHLLSFEIEPPSELGIMLVEAEESLCFTYKDVISQQVVFTLVSNNMTDGVLHLKAHYNKGENGLSLSSTLKIRIEPLISIPESFAVFTDGLTRIGLEALDASLLLENTGSMPVYTVLKEPSFGELVKIGARDNRRRTKRDSDELSSVLVHADNFTHQDVSLGHVFLLMKNNSFDASGDNIQFRLSVEDQSVPPAIVNFLYDVTDAEAEDFSEFLRSFLPSAEVPEDTTVAKMTSMSTKAMSDSDSGVVSGGKMVSEVTTSNSAMEEENDIDKATTFSVGSSDIKIKESTILWWIPATIAVGTMIIIVVIVTIIFCRRKRLLQKNRKAVRTEEKNSTLIKQECYDHQNSENLVLTHTVGSSLQPLSSPACPGVTVTLLHSETAPDVTETLLRSALDQNEDGPSYIASTYGPTSVRDGQQSTLYAPSTVYQYDDTGSIEFTDVTESDIFSCPMGFPKRNNRLYHAKSDKFIDPDVLALYSSDESIPSMLDEKYAVPCKRLDGLTGSVPAGLHRSVAQNTSGQVEISTSKSTASLTKISFGPELSLFPNTQLETNQYWI